MLIFARRKVRDVRGDSLLCYQLRYHKYLPLRQQTVPPSQPHPAAGNSHFRWLKDER